MYDPNPDTASDVPLDPTLRALVERLAEHHHDVWARNRMREGWTFGRIRDDLRKTDPALVPFAELPAEEQERERHLARGQVQTILRLGFAITRGGPTPDAGGRAGDRSDATSEDGSATGVEGARERAETLLGLGEPLLAYESIGEALVRWPRDLRLRQLRGLALARSGAAEHANRSMRELRDEGPDDGETLGILARTHKDLAARNASETERAAHQQQALRTYRSGYEAALRVGDAEAASFTGINAASLHLLLGEPERARELALRVRTLCREQLAEGRPARRYWLHATLAEAALLLGERAEAEAQYARAAALAGTRYADLCATRRQARRLLAHRGETTGWIDELLPVPPVVVCAGHMIDAPDRPAPRFPPGHEVEVARAIRQRLRRLRPAAGYASAACGADLLFLEALLEESWEAHVVLPFPPAAYVRTSVDVVPGGDWSRRFDRVLAAAASVTAASDDLGADGDSSFVYANLVLSGMAELHAQRLDTDLVGLAVWDGHGAERPGGTGSIVRHWLARGLAVERIDPDSPARDERVRPRATAGVSARPATEAADELPHPLMAMLFADAVGYSELGERQIPLFVEHVLSPIAALIDRTPDPPVLRETAGDGLYLVFREVRHAGLFALSLQDLLAGVDWATRGLPETFGLRVALHCGPVHELVDPITGQRKYTGPHTSRAARIEPITPPGQVYASQAFAAVAAATGVTELAFEYVGRTALAKAYGTLALYHVRRA